MDDRQDVDAWVILVTDDFQDFCRSGVATVRILRDPGEDFMTIDGTKCIVVRDDR